MRGLGAELCHPDLGIQESCQGKVVNKEGQSSGDAACLCMYR